MAALLLLSHSVASLILGSASPRRARLLSGLGVPFDVRPSAIEESVLAGEDAEEHTVRLARAKAQAVARSAPDAWVLGTDTVVVLDGEILGKPADPIAARRTLGRLSGREHSVVTGVSLVAPGGAVCEELHEQSVVRFRKLTADEIAAYVASGEPLDKAGSYGIQGGAADFVARLQGSYENVVGLPVDAVREMLRRAGLYPPRVGP
jgi:septum formation protein